MQFEYDPERLILEIKKRPGIWDYDDMDYRTKKVRVTLWNEVVTELMQTNPDINVSKSEMRELEIQLQKKWKSIRDSFHKYTLNPHRTSKPYIYAKHLQFLLKDQSIPKKDEGASSGSEYGPKRRRTSWKSKKTLKFIKNEDQSSEDDILQVENDDSREFSNDDTPLAKAETNTSQVDEFVFANVDTPLKSDCDDPDRLFLLSLLPHLKTIPEEQRLNVKMELMQVLHSANYNTAKQHKII